MITELNASPAQSSRSPNLLGPFLGIVTPTSIKIWLHLEGSVDTVHVTVHEAAKDEATIASGTLTLKPERMFADCTTISGLRPDTEYRYRLWIDPKHSVPLDLQGLERDDLHFWTLPDEASGGQQLDFLVMSCHNPFMAQADGLDGHAIWADLLKS